MRITCPHCGVRDVQEFSCLGEASAIRPPADASTEAFAQAVYLRDNPAGPTREFWYHAAGCRAWLVASRDTRSHAILAVEPARDVALARGATGSAA